MTFMRWSNALELGVPEVDGQHHKLVDLLNALDSGVKNGYSVNILASVLAELSRYTVCHFTFEERLMETHHLSVLEEHRVQHRQFADLVADFSAQFAAGRTDISSKMLAFLRDWLTDHILDSDRAFANEFLAATAGTNGVPAAPGAPAPPDLGVRA